MLMAAICIWSLSYGLNLQSASPEVKLLWTKIGYFGIITIPISALNLAIQLSLHKNIHNKYLYTLLSIEPVAVVIFILTNANHHLFWKSISLVPGKPFFTLVFDYGPVFWIHSLYSNLLIFIGLLLLFRIMIYETQPYRWQALILMIGTLFPWLGHLAYIAGQSPVQNVNLTPFIFAFISPLLAWELFHFRFLEILPIAQDVIIENMGDGVIVLDSQNRLVTMNAAAEQFIGSDKSDVINIPAEQVFAGWPELLNGLHGYTVTHTEITVPLAPDIHRDYDLRITPLFDQFRHFSGRLIVVREITKQKRYEEARHRRAQELSALHSILLDITASRDLPILLQTIVEKASFLLHAQGGCLYLCNPDQKLVRQVVSYNNPRKNSVEAIPYDQGEAGLVAQSGQPLIIEDYRSWPRRIQSEEEERQIISLVGVPMMWQGQVTGVITVFDVEEKHRFTLDDLELLTMLANQASIAIENSQLYNDERQRAEELYALQETMADISSELELPKLLQAILERSAAFLNASGGELGLYDEIKKELIIVASHQMGKDFTGTHMTLGEGVMGKVAQTCQPMMISDYHHWDGQSSQYVEGNWHSVMAAPLLIAGRLVGIIGIADSSPERVFTPSQQQLLIMFAQQAAIAVENARLYQSARDAAERRVILHKASQEVVAASLDPEGIYAAIHKAASQLMPSEAFAITLKNDTDNVIDAVYIFDHKGRAPFVSLPTNRGLSGHVISTGESLYIEDMLLKLDSIDSIRIGDKEEVRSILAVPIKLGDKVIGMLSSQSYQPSAYTTEDQSLLEMLASYAAIGLDNARLFSEVQKLAITDSLTGIYNRRHLIESGQREFSRSRRFQRPLSVILLDIDRFKVVNDTYGHPVGDQVLQVLTRRIQTMIREIDILGRYGGEEFIIVLPETQRDAAAIVAERLRMCAGNIPIQTSRGNVVITLSLGIAEDSYEVTDFEALVARADEAMYAAKNAGRDRIWVR